MANFLSFEKLEYYHGKLLTKINGLLSGKADKSEVNDLNEGFSEVIKQMYGADITENGAPTIREIAQDESSAVQGNLTTHINDTTPHITGAERTKLAGIETGAQVNQPAFSNVKVGTTTIVADAQTDTLEFVAGNGITITPDATNDKVTIANSGVRTVTTGSSNGTISVNGNNVAVKGLGSAAYTASTAYETPTNAQSKADAALASAKSYTNEKFNSIVGEGASEALDTIGEISAALQNNPDIITTLNQAIGNKVNKENGKGLSTNDYTTDEKNKLAGIAAGAQVNSITGIKGSAESSYRTGQVNITAANVGAVPTSRTINGQALSSNITLNATSVGALALNGTAVKAAKLSNTTAIGSSTKPVYFDANGVPVECDFTVAKSVPSNAVFTDTTYSAATTSASGLMTADMVSKLNGIAEGATKVTVDSALSSTSTNAIQNKVINAKVVELSNLISANSQTITTLANSIKEISTDQIDTLFT